LHHDPPWVLQGRDPAKAPILQPRRLILPRVTEPTGTPPAVRSIPLIRWAGLGGVAYVILFVIGFVVIHAGQPKDSALPGNVIHYYADSGHRAKVALGWFLVVLGVFFFLWFLAALRQAVRRPA